MTVLTKETQAILKDAGLGMDAVWVHKQSGKYIMYHWACESAAATKGITFDPPVVVTACPANKLAVIIVTGHLDDKTIWSFGEAAPYNTQQDYPFAMAEKRGVDRVTLKLLGLHGNVYSEEEADDFKQELVEEPPPDDGSGARQNISNESVNVADLREKLKTFTANLEACEDAEMLNALVVSHETLLHQCRTTKPDWYDGFDDFIGIRERIDEKTVELNTSIERIR